MAQPHRKTAPRPGRAARLITRMIDSGAVNAASLARLLGVRESTIVEYADGTTAIPLNQQARLALFAVAELPELTREGNLLRTQVAAAIAYETQRTVVHNASPPLRHRATPSSHHRYPR